ncbi:hypothetical protein CF327_g4531 [Tilletia walkeri]|nr:hypothetical protein CF327_g4531 [Tilletia walkeri]
MMLLLSYYSGLRPGSLMTSDKGAAYAQVREVSLIKRSSFEFSVEIKVKNFKGFSSPTKRAHKQEWVFHPVTKQLGKGARRAKTQEADHDLLKLNVGTYDKLNGAAAILSKTTSVAVGGDTHVARHYGLKTLRKRKTNAVKPQDEEDSDE